MLPREFSKCRKERVLAHHSDSHRNFLGKEKQSRWHQLRAVEGIRDVQGNDGAQVLHPLSVGERNPLSAGVWVLQCRAAASGAGGGASSRISPGGALCNVLPLLLQYNPNLSAFRAC